MKNTLFICIGFIALLGTDVCAGINGKYKVKGTERYYGSKYSFQGSVSVTGYNSGSFKIDYNDGDRSDGTYKLNFDTPLKETRKKQTVTCTWREAGYNGTATLTFKGTGGGYSVDFTYKATGASVRGTGSGSK